MPEVDEGGGKGSGVVVHPGGEFVRSDPAEFIDFGGGGVEGAVVVGAVNADEFMVEGVSIGAVGDLEEVGGVGESEFLDALAAGGGEVVLAGIEVAAGGGVPGAGVAVFGGGAELDEDLAGVVEDPDVGGAVEEAVAVDGGAGGGADDAVGVVNDIEVFFHGRGEGVGDQRLAIFL